MAYLLAVALPVAVAAAMIPLRAEHGRAVVLLLVASVMGVALLGATGPAIVAALSAALAYDLFLVEPYYTLAIDDADEIVAAITLLGVALVVGILNARLVRLHARESTRRDELRHLIAFTRDVAHISDTAVLTDAACDHITSVLNLRRCVWDAGRGSSTKPVLLPDGNVVGALTELNPDRAMLPDHLEIPVARNNVEIGRFVLEPTARHVVSFEERVTAAAIAELFGCVVDEAEPGVKEP